MSWPIHFKTSFILEIADHTNGLWNNSDTIILWAWDCATLLYIFKFFEEKNIVLPKNLRLGVIKSVDQLHCYRKGGSLLSRQTIYSFNTFSDLRIQSVKRHLLCCGPDCPMVVLIVWHVDLHFIQHIKTEKYIGNVGLNRRPLGAIYSNTTQWRWASWTKVERYFKAT